LASPGTRSSAFPPARRNKRPIENNNNNNDNDNDNNNNNNSKSFCRATGRTFTQRVLLAPSG
jgi:hypothetical protein